MFHSSQIERTEFSIGICYGLPGQLMLFHLKPHAAYQNCLTGSDSSDLQVDHHTFTQYIETRAEMHMDSPRV